MKKNQSQRIVNVGGCDCLKFFPSPFSLVLSLLTLPPSIVWRWSSFLCGTWCSLMQQFGSLLVFKVYYLSCYLASVTESASLALFTLTCKLLERKWYRNNRNWYKLIVFFIIHSKMRSKTHWNSWKCFFMKKYLVCVSSYSFLLCFFLSDLNTILFAGKLYIF